VPLQTRAALLFQDVDAIVLPTVARVPTVDECLTELVAPSVELGRLTAFVNPLAMAAVSVPTGVRGTGVPFGITFMGPAASDRALLALAATDASPAPTCTIAVVGAHLTGQPLNHQLTDLGAELRELTSTAPHYRLYALDTTPPKPGLVRDPGQGSAIEVEVWSISAAGLGAFVHAIPAPLGVGKLTLADGSEVTGFLCEGHAIAGAAEITHHGGWRAYLASRN
jgi:allophanate hydrolase